MDFAPDDIARLCITTFSNLPKQGKPSPGQWTVLSGIVLQHGPDLSLLSLATGTKCLSGSGRLSAPPGALVHDSHAEVLARRGAVHWAMDQVGRWWRDEGAGIFEKTAAGDKLDVREGVKFHLFTSHTPCGDAAIAPREGSSDLELVVGKPVEGVDGEGGNKNGAEPVEKNVEPLPKRPRLDITRTGAKCVSSGGQDGLGVGRLYHSVGLLRTKPGRGDRTLSLSCSDKMLKWNLVGWQGALCAAFIDKPLFLSSIVIGGEGCDEVAVERALYGRYDGRAEANKPRIFKTALTFGFEKNEAGAPCPDSILWTRSGGTEVYVEGMKQGWAKKKIDNPKSWASVSQRKMARLFVDTLAVVNNNCDILSSGRVNYDCLKMLSEGYNYKWKCCKKELKYWPEKIINQFSCEIQKESCLFIQFIERRGAPAM